MRLNKFIARATGVSRREADALISSGKVFINSQSALVGIDVNNNDEVVIDGKRLFLPKATTLIMLNKPVGYVCSRRAQARNVKTIYDILPEQYKHLKSIGRLDKDSSGLILLTDDGDLAHRLTHPKFAKNKQYIVALDRSLAPLHQQMISDFGINLSDGPSKLTLETQSNDRKEFLITMHEGRNRQIRRTFAALGYEVIKLHRISFDNYQLNNLEDGDFILLESTN